MLIYDFGRAVGSPPLVTTLGPVESAASVLRELVLERGAGYTDLEGLLVCRHCGSRYDSTGSYTHLHACPVARARRLLRLPAEF